MITKDGFEVVEELRKILSSIDGVSKINENIVMEYTLVVKDDSFVVNAEKVGKELSKQAEKHGFTLDVVVATQEQVLEAEKKLKDYLKANAKFA